MKGRDAADIFCDRLGPQGDRARALLSAIRAQIPTTSIIFDISTDRGLRSGSERITEVLYKALLRHLDYSTDLDLADLELALEVDNRLENFERQYEHRYDTPWRQRRSLIALSINEASAIMNQMDPQTFPAADSWAKASRNTDISPNVFAERVLELTRRRLGDRNIVFVADEVGQYVSRSTDKMLDLQGVVQALGRRGKGRIWFAVTSQERLDEVVDSLEGTRIELARVQDRFPLRVDLAPSDISEVTSKRVLTKKPDAGGFPSVPFTISRRELLQATLKSRQRLDPSTSTQFGLSQMYPFLPYQVDLIIDVVSGLRNQPGASRHTGGANRTIIKLAQQVLINPSVDLGSSPIGTLVTLDMIYDLVEGNVGQERRKDIADIERQFSDWSIVPKVAKAICLLQFVRGVPRTIENIAAVLYPAIGGDSLKRATENAVASLVDAQRIREGEAGYELLSVEGKRWEEERQGITARPANLERMKKEIAGEVLAGIKSYSYLNVRDFAPSISVNGESTSRGGQYPVRSTAFRR